MVAVIILVLVAGVGYTYWNRSKMVFESEMSCQFTELSKKTYGEMLQKLDDLAKSHSYQALSGSLHIPITVSNKILGIEGRNMVGSTLYEDINLDKNPIYIKVIAADNKVFTGLDTAILNYLNNSSPALLQKTNKERESISTKLDFLLKDMAIIDSSVNAYKIALVNSKKPVFDTANQTIEIASLLKSKSDMEAEYIALNTKLLQEGTTVSELYGFVPADFAVNEKNKILKNTIVLALFLPVVVTVGINFLRKSISLKTA